MYKFPLLASLIFEDVEFLEEGAKEDWIIKTYGQQLQQVAQADHMAPKDNLPALVDTLKNADPTRGKYLAFIAKMYAAGQFKIEDINRTKNTLADFDKYKAKIENKDIMTYQKFSDVIAAVIPHKEEGEPVSKRAEKQQIKSEDATKVIDTPNFKVIIPKTESAACLYGANTQWCTAAKNDNMFDHYNKQGPLYTIIAGDRKFQLHYESNQFMNEHDETLTKADIDYLSKYPEYKQFLNMLIKQHYS